MKVLFFLIGLMISFNIFAFSDDEGGGIYSFAGTWEVDNGAGFSAGFLSLPLHTGDSPTIAPWHSHYKRVVENLVNYLADDTQTQDIFIKNILQSIRQANGTKVESMDDRELVEAILSQLLTEDK